MKGTPLLMSPPVADLLHSSSSTSFLPSNKTKHKQSHPEVAKRQVEKKMDQIATKLQQHWIVKPEVLLVLVGKQWLFFRKMEKGEETCVTNLISFFFTLSNRDWSVPFNHHHQHQ
jgi:hypothetical protein